MPDQKAIPSLTTRIGRRAQRDFVRATQSPFQSRADRRLIVLCTHHKTGGMWFREVLLSVIRPYGLRRQYVETNPILRGTDFVFARVEEFDRNLLTGRSFLGVHVIRDPRDMVVSGYEYHKRTNEPWCITPDPEYDGMSYQEYLHSLNEHDGLMAEIRWVSRRSGAAMASWDYDQPEFLEIHYEDAIADEHGVFEQVFRWLHLSDRACRIGMDGVDRLTLRRGGAIPNHARSGMPGEWRERLTPDHVAYFKELTGDLVVRVGYETGPDW
jgi:Sulfotransferase domain